MNFIDRLSFDREPPDAAPYSRVEAADRVLDAGSCERRRDYRDDDVEMARDGIDSPVGADANAKERHVELPLVGVGLPVIGPHAGPEAIEAVATTVERLGYHSVSTSDRLLLPAHAGWINEFGLPEDPPYDVVEALTWVAAKTDRLRLRSDVVVALFQPPIVLARRLATLDNLSGGRLDVGLGQGWMPQEFEATGAPTKGRSVAFEESIAAIRACWGPDPVEFHGEHYHIPRSLVGPKPLRGSVAIQIGAVAKSAVERAARLGDGFTIGFRGWDETHEQIDWYREAGGQGPVVVKVAPTPQAWSERSLLDDLVTAKAAGVDQVVWDGNITALPIDRQLAVLEDLAPELRR
jgi:probable F420-dependent oxidoreductase